jgi:hypothetical protein
MLFARHELILTHFGSIGTKLTLPPSQTVPLAAGAVRSPDRTGPYRLDAGGFRGRTMVRHAFNSVQPAPSTQAGNW